MTIYDKVKDILRYYDVNRQCGHTTAMLEGARSVKSIIITHNQRFADQLKEKDPDNIEAMSIESVDHLMGRNDPIIFDNAAIFALLNEVDKELNRLQSDNRSLRSKLDQVKSIVDGYRRQ